MGETASTVDWGAIIREAAKSPLGVTALIVLVLGVVVVILFKDAGERYRLAAFVLLLLGLAGFGYSIKTEAEVKTNLDCSDYSKLSSEEIEKCQQQG